MTGPSASHKADPALENHPQFRAEPLSSCKALLTTVVLLALYGLPSTARAHITFGVSPWGDRSSDVIMPCHVQQLDT